MYDIADRESAIREVQRFLLELHYTTESIPFVAIDGRYDASTKNAVRAFQRLWHLPENGIVDLPTWKLLFREFSHARAERTGSQMLFPDTQFPITVGMRGEGIKNLQYLMNALAERYNLPLHSDISGVYSYSSSMLANAMRRIYRMKEDGTVTGILFDTMVRDYKNPPAGIV